MSGIFVQRNEEGFESAALEAASHLRNSTDVLIVAHIDADGITAASIASATLQRAGIEHTVKFLKKLDDTAVKILNEDGRTIWLVDLGSGVCSKFLAPNVVISDHHRPDTSIKCSSEGNDGEIWLSHVNPHIFGMDGSSEISGAGVTYVISRAMDIKNMDLAALAIVGAVGDFQDSADGHLSGYNRKS